MLDIGNTVHGGCVIRTHRGSGLDNWGIKMEINEWCKNCAKLKNCGMRIPCGHFEPKKPRTNFSRITASPESLAEFIAKSINDTIKLTNGNRKYTERIVQKEFWLEWLKQESE